MYKLAKRVILTERAEPDATQFDLTPFTKTDELARVGEEAALQVQISVTETVGCRELLTVAIEIVDFQVLCR